MVSKTNVVCDTVDKRDPSVDGAKLDGIETSADVTDATNVMAAGALMKVSTTTVAFNAVAATTLYTVPTGKIFIPVFAAIRIAADASTTAVTFGRSTALTDWLDAQTLTSLDVNGDYGLVMPAISATPGVLKTYAADVIFQINVTTGTGGATNYVDLFGYLVDA